MVLLLPPPLTMVKFSFFLLLLVLLKLPCHESRLIYTEHRRHEARYDHVSFDFLPRGMPIPPSGPSERHNSMVDLPAPP
ncbi:hypothetical protein HPP92_004854 [Vanilla planifolia]|uniref:Uncharacterized protein n=1 Tax=Vanilla planifolia TaxID=51239 RepID=A0A835VCN5_VANPL|nr:hypothetical protein HPP92_004854 [Vanilla planifolia]